MSQPTPNADRLRALLPPDIANQLRPTARLDYHIRVAIEQQHWTWQQLTAEATRDLATAGNLGAVITDRMAVCATIPPRGHQTTTTKKPFCSPECRDNAGMILDPDTKLPVGRCGCRRAA